MKGVALGAVIAGVLAATAFGGWYRQTEHQGGPLGRGNLAFGISVDDSVVNKPYTTGGGLRLCTLNGHSLILDRIAPARVRGAMTVEAVRVTEGYGSDIPNSPGKLSPRLDEVRGHPVRKRCDDTDGAQTYFGVQMSRGPGDAEFIGLKIHYRDGWKRYVKTYRFSAALCDPSGSPQLEICP